MDEIIYAYVDSIEAPASEGSGRRTNVVLDAISARRLESGAPLTESAEGLSVVRVMSTQLRLAQIGAVPLVEGEWYRVALGGDGNQPIAWSAAAEREYKQGERTNVRDITRLSTAPGSFEVQAKLEELCDVRPRRRPRNSPMPSFLGSRKPKRVRVLDVGHASCSAIHDEDGLVMGYFDVGGPVFFHHRTFPSQFAEAMNAQAAKFVVLSHWDFDHYSLALTKLPELLKLRWYAPIQKVGPNAARLQRLLGSRLEFLASSQFKLNDDLMLVRGGGKDRNNSGYAMRVRAGRDRILLPADANYDLLPLRSKSRLTGLCITHHGGAGAGSPPAAHGTRRTAAVSYGNPNRYRHPNPAAIAAHKASGWTVAPTVNTPLRGDVWLP